MSLVQTPGQLQLPDTLRAQLLDFRGRVWRIKMAEAVGGAVFGAALSFLMLFALDRVGETSAWIRACLFVATVLGCAIIPVSFHRWIWRNRQLAQLARLLSRKHPRIGDQLLGIIELVENEAEQARSRRLCEAAVQQVAIDAQARDFRDAVPRPRHRLWAWLAGVPAAAALVLLVCFPAAAANAWARLLSPWREIPRYTFAALEQLPDLLVVPHGEPFSLTLQLKDKTVSRPGEGVAEIDGQRPIAATLEKSQYQFDFPPQISSGRMQVAIGDFRQQVQVEPKLRPELTGVVAQVSLPEYLGLPEPLQKDVRGGLISLVKGSRARFTATASRELAASHVDGRSQTPSGRTVASPVIEVDAERKLEFRWSDRFGLSGKEPFTLTIDGRDDEAPSLVCEGLPRQKVVLDSELLTFKVRSHDDFGVKVVGLEWKGTGEAVVKTPANGESILASGGNDKDALEITGTFSAKSLNIEPQLVHLRVFVEDYFPDRERVYSPPHLLYVLNAEQHAIWLTEQLSKWHRQSLEVRDREMQLYETNKQLRALAEEELDQPETRRRIESQAHAERANGRRLSNLVTSGEDLVQQAMRNPEFGVGHLEKWAEMLQILKDISANRMPSVADLLKQASQAPQVAENAPSNKSAMAGQVRNAAAGSPSKNSNDKKPPSAVPSVADVESSHPYGKKKEAKAQEPSESKSNPRLTLAATTLIGNGGPDKKPAPAAEKVEEAVKQQQDLLAEFEKIADELNRVLAELEGSTLVKRLKAASRLQYGIAGRMGEQVNEAFGVTPTLVGGKAATVLAELSEQELKGSHNVSLIMDDMQAYFERRHFAKFKAVLDEMRQLDAIGSLRQLGDDLRKENGLSIAQCEYWSDTLDRWAEDLVDPACCGCCPGSKSKGSLPPSIVLEVLQILEGEVNLREETRVAEQARPAVTAEEHKERGAQLSKTQAELQERVVKVIARIRELPDAESDFGKELQLLGLVSAVMEEAAGILAQPDTGSPAIAAETEAIELLLQSKRINPKGGGGGGSNPGGGGGGKTQDSALTLLGGGVNDKEVREDRGVPQSTGQASSALPEEFRAGLDEYFNRLDRGGGGEKSAP